MRLVLAYKILALQRKLFPLISLKTCVFSFSILPPQMGCLCRHLDQLWEENQGCEILFTWIQFLKEEALDSLGIQSPLEIISKAGIERKRTDPAGKVVVLLKGVGFSLNAEFLAVMPLLIA